MKDSLIIIMTPTLVDNDAITNDVLKQSHYLIENGFEVNIYAENNLLAQKEPINFINLRSLEKKILDPDCLIIYHHSMYWGSGEEIIARNKGINVMKHHNITPPEFFTNYSDNYYNITQQGIEQTRFFIQNNCFQYYLADSQYNANDLLQYAEEEFKVDVIPPFTKLEDMEEVSLNLDICRDQIKSSKTKLLFIGRFAPNKGIHHLVHIVKEYVNHIDQNISLNILGNIDPQLSSYREEIEGLIQMYSLSNYISIKGKTSFADLITYLKTSDIYLLCSEHEGFCVPILEAQYANLPIIAYLSSAIKGTLGNEQFGLDSLDYLKFAVAIKKIVSNPHMKLYLSNSGQKNLHRFTDRKIATDLLTFLKSIKSKETP